MEVVKKGDSIQLMATGGEYILEELGVFKMGLSSRDELSAGDVGYAVAGIKTISDIRVGDTITTTINPCKKPLPGFKEVKPVVFSSIYPVDSNDYEELQEAIDRLKLNDASLVYEKTLRLPLGLVFVVDFLECFT